MRPHINLMRPSWGEPGPEPLYHRRRYGQRENLYVVQQVFLFTADQELTHAKQFYRQLADLSGQTIRTDGTYPVDLYPDLLSHLRAAQHNEFQEWGTTTPTSPRQPARRASPWWLLFDSIAGIERIHGERFGRFADLLEREELFVSSVTCQWMCLNCGYVVESTMAPASCPVCHHPQGYSCAFRDALCNICCSDLLKSD